jgi:hypothetical protein
MGEEKEEKGRENTNCNNELLNYDIIIEVWIRYFTVSRKILNKDYDKDYDSIA